MEENTNEKVTNEVIEENNLVTEEQNEAVEEISTQEENNTLTEKKKSKKPVIIIAVLLLAVIIAVTCFILFGGEKKDDGKENIVTSTDEKASPLRLSGNGLENFDLEFLKLEDNGKNVVYSPLSIKYMLAMLNEGTEGNSNAQIKALIGDYKPNKYENNANMSLANVFFVKNDIKEDIKSAFVEVLKEKYNADVVYDEFKEPTKVNDWIKNKTLNLIDKLLDKIDQDDLFYIVNALGIDMEWYSKFIPEYNKGYTGYVSYPHMIFSWDTMIISQNFNGSTDDNDRVVGMEVGASFMNYDVIKAHGGEDAYRKELTEWHVNCYNNLDETKKFTAEDVSKEVDEVINSIKEAYGDEKLSTDFSLYVDDNVKVFAKDLKEYNGRTLQYVGFMPINEELSAFIKNVDASKLTDYINKLKPAKGSSFKQDVNTKITGYIPMFKYEYNLNLKDDLKQLGVTDIFDLETAKLGKIIDKPVFINKALHKANIDFNDKGIKASAASLGGGAGNTNGPCYYEEKVPYEEIDISFNKPYMYIVRDKSTGEVWFTGSVYQPLKWNEVEDQQ